LGRLRHGAPSGHATYSLVFFGTILFDHDAGLDLDAGSFTLLG